MAAPFQPGATPQMQRNGKHHFMNVPGAVNDGGRAHGVAAAGLIPCMPTADPNRLQLLLQVEDMKVNGDWVPGLAMFGGKVNGSDTHWTGTALRETQEELGPAVLQHIQPWFDGVAAIDPLQLPALRGATCTYVPGSKYQVFFLPVSEAEAHVHGLLQLPGTYYHAYQGRTSNDEHKRDWSRAAYMLVWVEVQRTGPGQDPPEWRVNATDLSHLAGAPAFSSTSKWAEQLAKPWTLPLKVELRGALERWTGL